MPPAAKLTEVPFYGWVALGIVVVYALATVRAIGRPRAPQAVLAYETLKVLQSAPGMSESEQRIISRKCFDGLIRSIYSYSPQSSDKKSGA